MAKPLKSTKRKETKTLIETRRQERRTKRTIQIVLFEFCVDSSHKVKKLSINQFRYSLPSSLLDQHTICHVSLLTPFPPFSVMYSNHRSLYATFQPGSRLGVYMTSSSSNFASMCCNARPLSPAGSSKPQNATALSTAKTRRRGLVVIQTT
jgi:hypothetical protein